MITIRTANTVWFLFGGLIIALEYCLASLALLFTVVGIPFARKTFRMGASTSGPFGKRFYRKKSRFDRPPLFLYCFWIIFGGIWIALSHLILGIFFTSTVIGFPFARQHFRLAAVALSPYGVKILNDSFEFD